MLSRGRVIFISLSILTVLLVASGRMLAEQNRQVDDGQDSLYKYLAVFTEVFSLVNRAYVDELEEVSLMSGALEGTLDALDPFSLYVPSDGVEGFQNAREIGVGRSGLLVLKERGVAYAARVDEGSPAAEAGLERGHILSMIQGQSTRELPLYEIQGLLAGELGTEIEIERIHEGRKDELRFALAEYPRPGSELTVERGVAVLRLAVVDAATVADVTTSLETLRSDSPALEELTEQGKLLLDLRGVAGGSPDAAYRVAGLFATGELGALRGREGDLETFQGGLQPAWEGDVVVLVDRGTQGAAEVLSTVLRQRLEASLVGDRSFGHCGRLGMIELSDGDQLQITDAFYTGPDREPINSSLQPDVWVRPIFGAEEDPELDPALEQGLDVLLGEDEVEEQKAA